MIQNYLKIALRTFWKNKVFTAITLFGLSVGISCFILLYLFVRHERSFDQFHSKKDQIFRLMLVKKYPEGSEQKVGYESMLRSELLQTIMDENPGIERGSCYQYTSWHWMEHGEKMILDDIGFVENDFLSMFDFPLIEGDATTVMSQPDSIVLSESMVTYFFGDQHGDYSQVMGKVMTIPKSKLKDFVVRGVMKDLPENTIFKAKALIPFVNAKEIIITNNDLVVMIFSWKRALLSMIWKDLSVISAQCL